MWILYAACRSARYLFMIAITISGSALPAMAQSRAPLIINSDLGGRVGVRANQIINIRSSGQQVKIVGPLCLSSCTMYLGAGDVCISPKTVFGFHGPSFYGTPLSKPGFEYWSDVISSFYPTPLRSWYMTTARHKTSGMHRVSGSELIKMGYTQC
jgi:hypothetical protein